MATDENRLGSDYRANDILSIDNVNNSENWKISEKGEILIEFKRWAQKRIFKEIFDKNRFRVMFFINITKTFVLTA